MIGLGVGAAGTCLLVLLASLVAPERRAAAASITWIMMIAGFAITAGIAGEFLDPFSMTRLINVTAVAGVIALTVATLALRGLEPATAGAGAAEQPDENDGEATIRFVDALRDVLTETHTRRFAVFVFISMLAYSAQDLVLEPFAGAVFFLTPGQSTQLGGLQHGGVLVGMLLFAAIGYKLGQRSMIAARTCMLAGCLGSAGLLATLAVAGFQPQGFPLGPVVFALGIANGVFAVAAIGAMMGLVSEGHARRDGVRMGVWGAAQALAFGAGGIVGTLVVDIVRFTTDSSVLAYSIVFAMQAILFGCAAWLAAIITSRRAAPKPLTRNLEHVY
jgi:BCD family chlorophyll transporter-like MFS transporter